MFSFLLVVTATFLRKSQHLYSCRPLLLPGARSGLETTGQPGPSLLFSSAQGSVGPLEF